MKLILLMAILFSSCGPRSISLNDREFSKLTTDQELPLLAGIWEDDCSPDLKVLVVSAGGYCGNLAVEVTAQGSMRISFEEDFFDVGVRRSKDSCRAEDKYCSCTTDSRGIKSCSYFEFLRGQCSATFEADILETKQITGPIFASSPTMTLGNLSHTLTYNDEVIKRTSAPDHTDHPEELSDNEALKYKCQKHAQEMAKVLKKKELTYSLSGKKLTLYNDYWDLYLVKTK